MGLAVLSLMGAVLTGVIIWMGFLTRASEKFKKKIRENENTPTTFPPFKPYRHILPVHQSKCDSEIDLLQNHIRLINCGMYWKQLSNLTGESVSQPFIKTQVIGTNYHIGKTQFLYFMEKDVQKRLGASEKFKLSKTQITSFSVNSSAPTMFDSRDDSTCVGPIKDQKCAASSFFSVVAAIEYSHCKKHGNYPSLSKKEVIDCAVRSICEILWPDNILDTYIIGRAYVTTDDNPYFYEGRTWNNNKNKYFVMGKNEQCEITNKKIALLASYGKVEGNLENALYQNGVLSAVMTVVETFFFYKKGIYEDSGCTTQASNHAVNIVGYDNNTVPQHWIGRNSWGTQWGELGYFRIKKGVNMCNIETFVYYVVAE